MKLELWPAGTHCEIENCAAGGLLLVVGAHRKTRTSLSQQSDRSLFATTPKGPHQIARRRQSPRASAVAVPTGSGGRDPALVLQRRPAGREGIPGFRSSGPGAGQPPPSAWNRLTIANMRLNRSTARVSSAVNSVCSVWSRVLPALNCCSDRSKARRDLFTALP
jgi:hypothetical protein